MGTRAAAFTARVKNLNEIQLRLLQGSVPLPQGHEIANSLKYFSTTLLGVLRDVPGRPLVMLGSKERDADRLALFPSLDYRGLHQTLLQFMDLVHVMPSGLAEFGKALLCTLSSLVPFLERDLIDTLPYDVASMLVVFPAYGGLVDEIVNVLCWQLLPFTVPCEKPVDNCALPNPDEVSAAAVAALSGGSSSSGGALGTGGNGTKYPPTIHVASTSRNATNSASAILMIVYQFVKENSALHRKVTECLMALKEDLAKDLLCVIAHGTPNAKLVAANMLFYYWPSLSPTHYDRRNIMSKFNSSATWSAPLCCSSDCHGKDKPDVAVKVCLDHTISLAHQPDRPPPSFFCNDCYNRLVGRSGTGAAMFDDINHPIVQMDSACENKNCRSSDKLSVAMCFSKECTGYNFNRPVRLCGQCNKIRHNTRRGADHIIYTTSIPSPWDMEPETKSYLVKAVISLLQEARPYGSGSNRDLEDTHRRTLQVVNINDDDDLEEDEATLNERRLLSKYGVWLLAGLCSPTEDANPSTFGHMLSMLFQWFNATAYLPNDKTAEALEKLKSEYLPQWLRKIFKSYPDVFISCLLPNPPDYARVGGHWDAISSPTEHIKEGLVRFFCLVPYDVISLEVWSKAMSHWMEAINEEVPRDELCELKSVFVKIFDPDMSPLGFDSREMYQFVAERFSGTTAEVQRQALQWLQKLCLLNIHVPFPVLFQMFNAGVQSLQSGPGIGIPEPGAPSLLVETGNLQQDLEAAGTSGAGNPQPNLSQPHLLSPTTGLLDEEAAFGNVVVLDPSGTASHHDQLQQQQQRLPGLEDGPLVDDDDDDEDPEGDEGVTREELNLTCFNLMIDVLNSQMELQDIEKHTGLNGPHTADILSLVNKMLSTPWLSDVSMRLADTRDAAAAAANRTRHPDRGPGGDDDNDSRQAPGQGGHEGGPSAAKEATPTGTGRDKSQDQQKAKEPVEDVAANPEGDEDNDEDDDEDDEDEDDDFTVDFGGDLEMTLLEELLTDLMQLIHATVRNVTPAAGINDADVASDDGGAGGGGAGGGSSLGNSNGASNDPMTSGIAGVVTGASAGAHPSGDGVGGGKAGLDPRNAILKKGPTTGLGGFMAVLTTMQSTVEKPAKEIVDECSSTTSSQEGFPDDEYVVRLDDYGVPLQLVYHLLLRNAEIVDADMRFYLLDSVRLLALQCDVLASAQKKHKRFLVWCQESLLTGILWRILESAHSQVALVAVPLLLHSVTLPGGTDVLWRMLDEDFHHSDWRVRFAAVEKVTVIFRFLDERPVRKSPALKSVLSHAFCCLIACMDDALPQVSQRASLYLGTVHDSSLNTLMFSLEYQFDTVPIDRPAILKRLYQLFTCLMDRRILTWQFFASRFEVIISEIQQQQQQQPSLINLAPSEKFSNYGGGGCSGSRSRNPTVNSSRMAHNANQSCDYYAVASCGSISSAGNSRTLFGQSSTLDLFPAPRKPHRSGGGDRGVDSVAAAEAEFNDVPNGDNGPGVLSLSAGLKYPYKRTISAPAGMGLSKSVASLHHHHHQCHQGHQHHQHAAHHQARQQQVGGPGTSGHNTPSSCHRQQSVPILKGKVAREMCSGSLSSSAHVLTKQCSNVGAQMGVATTTTAAAASCDDCASYGYGCGGGGSGGAGGSMEYANIAAKTVDLDEVDKETIHLLVFLFMQFLSQPDQAVLPNLPEDGSSSTSAPGSAVGGVVSGGGAGGGGSGSGGTGPGVGGGVVGGSVGGVVGGGSAGGLAAAGGLGSGMGSSGGVLGGGVAGGGGVGSGGGGLSNVGIGATATGVPGSLGIGMLPGAPMGGGVGAGQPGQVGPTMTGPTFQAGQRYLPHVRAFQCLYSLLGYNEQERRFTTMPNKVRCAPAVNSFFANLQQVLDNNYVMGENMLLNCILILQKTPFPPRFATSLGGGGGGGFSLAHPHRQTPHTLSQERYLFQGCGFSLWHLEPPMRKNWLTSVLVIAYKYNYSPDTVIGEKVVGLTRILIHTLAAHAHVCNRYGRPATGSTAAAAAAAARSARDTNQLQQPSGGSGQEAGIHAGGEDEDKDDEEFDEEDSGGMIMMKMPVVDKDREAAAPTDAHLGSALRPQSPPRTTTKNKVHSPEESAAASDKCTGLAVDKDPERARANDLSDRVAALPEGWAMQTMRSGRTLFIDSANQVTTWSDPRPAKTGPPRRRQPGEDIDYNDDDDCMAADGEDQDDLVASTLVFESPPSPMSLMDLMTVGSPVAVDRSLSAASPGDDSSSSSSAVTVTAAMAASGGQLPPEERLLPIGSSMASSVPRRQTVAALPGATSRIPAAANSAKDSNHGGRILDRVWQVLGSLEQPQDAAGGIGGQERSSRKGAPPHGGFNPDGGGATIWPRWPLYGEVDIVPQLIEERITDEKIQVVASIQKQDSSSSAVTATSANTPTTTEFYVGHVTHFRNGGPAVVLESRHDDDDDHEDNDGPQAEKDPSPTGRSSANWLPAHDSGKHKLSVSSDTSTRVTDEARDEAPEDLQLTSEAIQNSRQKGDMIRRRRKLGASSSATAANLSSVTASSAAAAALSGWDGFSLAGDRPPEEPQEQQQKGASSKAKGTKTTQSRMNSTSSLFSTRDNPLLVRQSHLRVGEDSIIDRCSRCGTIREEYSEDEIGHCLIILSTFINREPSLIAPLLPEILLTVTRVARETQYPWEMDQAVYVPGNSRSIAKQFVRCVLHQLSGNGIFSMLFTMELAKEQRRKFLSTIAACLMDFAELNPSMPVAIFLQEMNDRRTLTNKQLDVCLPNLACYLSYLPYDQVSNVSQWNNVFQPAELFFRKLWALTGSSGGGGSHSRLGSGCGSSHAAGSTAAAATSDYGGAASGKGAGGGVGGVGAGGSGGGSGGGPEDSLKLANLVDSLFEVMTCVLKMNGVQNHRFVLDPISKLISYSIQTCSLSLFHLANICYSCNKVFPKERDRLVLTRTAVFEFVQALKFKVAIPDSNFLMLADFVLRDSGGAVIDEIAHALHDSTSAAVAAAAMVAATTAASSGAGSGTTATAAAGCELGGYGAPQTDLLGNCDPSMGAGSSANPSSAWSLGQSTNVAHIFRSTGACDVARVHMNDILEFLADVHTLTKVKSIVKGMTIGLNEDTLGGILKASLAQYLALEISKGNGRDSRSVNRYLPWLYNLPANTATQGPREFLDCISHIRLMSWLLLGSLNHTLRFGASEISVCQPIPLEASCHIADHIQVILAGFAEQSKTSVVHMCSLFHAFILCQLWTVYLEQTIAMSAPRDEAQMLASSILLDYWGKVTPGILQLVSHSKVLAEMVNLHFLLLMEALMECNSTVLGKLLPLWCPVFFAYNTQLPDHVRVRLQAVQNYKPQEIKLSEQKSHSNAVLIKWLQRLQFKMGQIEMQASNVTQFFIV